MENLADNSSGFNPFALGILVVMVWFTLRLTRAYACIPLLITIFILPLGQMIVIGGLHFHFFRIVMLAGVLRIISKGELAKLTIITTDRILLWWALVTVLFGTMAAPSWGLLVNRSGDAYNAVCCYFFLRSTLVETEDVYRCANVLGILCVVVSILMLVEKTTSHNLFSVFGGVPEIAVERKGSIRCQGAFRHPILAGTVGATQIPLFAALWVNGAISRWRVGLFVGSAMVMVVTASSSGALLSAVACIAGLMLWRVRPMMRLITWVAIIGIVFLSVFMQAPVWYIIAKLGNSLGGTGWHRAYLIDQAVGHFNEWWLFGTVYTAHWGPGGLVIEADPNMMDITNHYIMEGVKGGILKLVLFCAMIVGCFKMVSRKLNSTNNSKDAFLAWSLGVALFAHALSFLSITYFDQTILLWFWLIAAIPSIIPERVNSSGAAAVTSGESVLAT